jgi:hypothetical protein
MKLFKYTMGTLLLGMLLVGFVGCGDEGAGERAGKALDEMMDDAENQLDEAKKKTEE